MVHIEEFGYEAFEYRKFAIAFAIVTETDAPDSSTFICRYNVLSGKSWTDTSTFVYLPMAYLTIFGLVVEEKISIRDPSWRFQLNVHSKTQLYILHIF
jgi:hypothetical protein